jgi:hypothetical protein
MMRPLGILALYVVAGTILTIVGYRLVLNGPLADAVAEKSVEGLVIFLSIVMNIALVFAAAGVASVMLEQSRVSFPLILIASAVIAGVVGTAMTFWFVGLSPAFPVTMAAGGALCALAANALGLLGRKA